MSHSTDDLYALVLPHAEVMHGACAEEEYPNSDFPDDSTVVLYGDAWRGEVYGICVKCKLFVDPND